MKKENKNMPSQMYRLMIYFAHSTMVIYDKETVSKKGMSVGEFQDANKKLMKRVFEEGLSIMEYELSSNQMEKACAVYLGSKYYPTSVSKTKPFKP